MNSVDREEERIARKRIGELFDERSLGNNPEEVESIQDALEYWQELFPAIYERVFFLRALRYFYSEKIRAKKKKKLELSQG